MRRRLRQNPTPDEVSALGRAYLDGEDVALSPEGQAMALEQARRVVREFDALRRKIDIVFTDDDPYTSFEQMRDDVRSHRRMLVYTGGSETPLWSPQVNWMARAVHDWDHLQAGVDFSLVGELEAFRFSAARAPALAPLYLSEIALQAAASTLLGGFASGPQKLVFARPGVERIAAQARRNGRQMSQEDLARLTWDAAGQLRFMEPDFLMVHLREQGLDTSQAVQVALAASYLRAARVE